MYAILDSTFKCHGYIDGRDLFDHTIGFCSQTHNFARTFVHQVSDIVEPCLVSIDKVSCVGRDLTQQVIRERLTVIPQDVAYCSHHKDD